MPGDDIVGRISEPLFNLLDDGLHDFSRHISFGGGHNVSLADAVPLALHCGEPGYPSDAVAILGLSDIVSRTADAAVRGPCCWRVCSA